VARALLERGRKVRTLVRGAGRVRELEVELAFGDLRDPDSLADAMKGCDTVYHVAGDYRLWSKHPDELYGSNVDGTRNMLAAALKEGVERFVYTSTVGCIGFVKDGLGDENTPASLQDMTGHYKRSKFMAEKHAIQFASVGLPLVIVNPTAPVGGHDFKPTPTGRTILEFLKGRMPAYLDTGLNLVDVRDVAEGHLLACEHGKKGERYILGCENLTLKEVFDRLSSVSGRPAPERRIPYVVALAAAVADEAKSRITGKAPRVPLEGVRMAKTKMFVTHEKAACELGYRPGPVDQALSRAVNWFRENGYC
jgi:dihydroflavonol-4-reductase